MAKPHVKLERPGDQRKRRADANAELKPATAANVEQHGPRGQPKSTADLAAYSIPEFCRRHAISRSTYYNLKRLGEAPRETRVRRRILITAKSAATWLREQEKRS